MADGAQSAEMVSVQRSGPNEAQGDLNRCCAECLARALLRLAGAVNERLRSRQYPIRSTNHRTQ
jgi:hypothetical protein